MLVPASKVTAPPVQLRLSFVPYPYELIFPVDKLVPVVNVTVPPTLLVPPLPVAEVELYESIAPVVIADPPVNDTAPPVLVPVLP